MEPVWREFAIYYSRFAVAAVLVLGGAVAWALNSVSLQPVPPVQYNTYECASGRNPSAAVFRVLVYAESQAIKHADALCRDAVVQERYGGVHTMWRHRDLSEVRISFDQQFDLLFAKPELVERKDIELVDHYVPIAVYADNTSRFVSLSSLPELSSAYFHGRKLGLLDNPNSVSGHQVPRRALRNVGIDERRLDVRYYETHEDLYSALLSGELDVIATGRALPESQHGGQPFLALPIQGGLKAARWYLRPSLVDTPLHCRIAGLLKEISDNSDTIVARGLKVARDCAL
jgi:hypothetical protein